MKQRGASASPPPYEPADWHAALVLAIKWLIQIQPCHARIMRRRHVTLLLLAIGSLPVARPDSAKADGTRYLAVFTNGERLEGERITGWQVADGTPMLDSAPLKSDGRDLRWLRDKSLLVSQSVEAAGAVKFVGGDRLPGEVVGYVEPSVDGTPENLLVRTNQAFNHPTTESTNFVRVSLESVCEVVWGARSQLSLEPSTILLADGRRIRYRSLRWSQDSVRVLTNDGIQRYAFAEISRLKLPTKDFWTTYYKEVATLCPGPSTRLVRLETTTGLLATASDVRFDALAVIPPEERQRAATMKALVARHEQRRRDFSAKIKGEKRKLDQKTKEYQRKREQQLRKLQNDLRNMRNRMKNVPADEVNRKVKEFDERNRKRIEETTTRLTKNYKTIFARNVQRSEDQIRDIDKQIQQIKQGGVASDGGGNPQLWYHMVHPAWSLDPLWVKFNSVRTRWSFSPHEIPLSRIEPTKVAQRSTLGGSWTWQTNRNVRGGALRSAAMEYGWGFGVHASNELHFAIPSLATGFRSFIGLDDSVGTGGCIRAEVHVFGGDESQHIFRSDFLVGSANVVSTGQLQLSEVESPSTLTLIIHAAHENRPPGADPLDVRDHVNWLEPILDLDPAALQSKLRQHLVP